MTRKTEPRLTRPAWVLLTAPPARLDATFHRFGKAPYWGVSWRRWGGRLTLSPLRAATDFPACEPLSVLVHAPADCDEVWASLVVGGTPARFPCKVSPVTTVADDRHDPAAGLYFPPAFPNVILGV